ncbi:MAG: hypothetical protein LLG37_03100 [Spirochaetia bacterium]|nr:hypothetical protein [Spirochaetia bacterium]
MALSLLAFMLGYVGALLTGKIIELKRSAAAVRVEEPAPAAKSAKKNRQI